MPLDLEPAGTFEFGLAASDDAVLKNPAPQSALADQKSIRAGSHGFVHPVAGFAFLNAFEKHPAKAETAADEFVQIHSRNEDIPAKRGAVESSNAEGFAHFLDHLAREKSDLLFLAWIFVVVAVPRDAFASMALGGIEALHAMFEAALTVTAFEIVARRNPNVVNGDAHCLAQ